MAHDGNENPRPTAEDLFPVKKLNFADPKTNQELTAYVYYGHPDSLDGVDKPVRIMGVKELTDADSGEAVDITESIRAAIDAEFAKQEADFLDNL